MSLSTVEQNGCDESNGTNINPPIKVALRSRFWFACKKMAIIDSCSMEEATLISLSKLRVGQKITLSITSGFFYIKPISAKVVAANPGFDKRKKEHRYKIRFIFDNMSEPAAKTLKNMLQTIDHIVR